jgi:cell wall assembly regulator SMI1
MPETGYNHVANPGQSSAGSFINDGRPRQASAWQGSSKLPPSALYPPLSHTWERVNNFLTNTYPELSDSLNFPSSLDVIDVLERTLNMRLPSSVRDSYLCADGQDIDGGATEGLFFGLALLPLEDVLREWQFWRQAEADPRTGGNPKLLKSMSSFPPKWVKKAYANRGWLPLISDRAGNYVGVDLDPGPMGEWGQVIVFGRDFDTKAVLWKGEGEGGWGRWLAAFADELEAGETWELDGSGRGTDSVRVVTFSLLSSCE